MPLPTRQYLKKLNHEVNRLQDQVGMTEYKYCAEADGSYFDDGLYENSTNGAAYFTEMTSSILPVSLASTSSAVSTRDGDSIRMQNLTIRGAVHWTPAMSLAIHGTGTNGGYMPNPGSAYSNQATCRFVIMIAKVSDPSMVFSSYDNAGNYIPYFRLNEESSVLVGGPFNPKGDEVRFSTNTLYDQTFVVSEFKPTHLIDINIPLNFRTTYDHETVAAVTNSIHYMFISDRDSSAGASLTTRCPYYDITWRLSYTDA